MIKKLLIITCYLLLVTFVTPTLAMAATLSLSPSSGTFNKGCPYNVEIKLDTGSKDTDGTDAIVIFDASKFTAKVTEGNIYSDYPGTSVDNEGGKITVSGLASVSSAYNSKGTAGTLATIELTVKETAGTGATLVKFDYDSNDRTKTTDSNVVERGTVADILSSVTNGNYTIGTGACGAGGAVSTLPKTGQGAPSISTPSATPQPPVSQVPPTQLPPAGSEQLTFTIAIIGSVLTVLGILGLALL